MSLLMDALKKAELAKRKAQVDGASASGASTPPAAETPAPDVETPPAEPDLTKGFSAEAEHASSTLVRHSPPQPEPFELLEDTAAAKPAMARRITPKSAFSLQEIDESPSRSGPPAAEIAGDPLRESVQNLFESKQPTASRKTFAIAAGTGTLLALVAIGVYFWVQLQPASRPGLLSREGAGTTNTAIQQPAAPAFVTPATNDSTAATQPAPRDDPYDIQRPPAVTRPLESNRVDQTESYREESDVSSAPAAPPARKLFRTTTSRPQANPAGTLLDRGYDALSRGDDAAAKNYYGQVLANTPKNVDALAGLAVVAQRAGNSALAAEYYLQILDADPKNTTALAGLIDLQSRMNPAEAESRIKQSLATQPDSPALYFSLGNVYARSKRWTEAQQAYFKAMSGDPGNPDYLFNLAVSLDQLHQPKPAASYYEQAIAAANHRPSSFDKVRASERLQQLQ